MTPDADPARPHDRTRGGPGRRRRDRRLAKGALSDRRPLRRADLAARRAVAGIPDRALPDGR
ncbi:MAG TPA: hypothetical protein DCP38_11160 [Acidobacteria bacterium]|nr:hypothetical protein [Acidobacteriota bacterium]